MSRRILVALVDLSGTIHIEDSAIKGAIGALQRLTASGVAVRYVTNTTKEPLRLLHARLCRLGFHIAAADVFTSLSAARRVIETRHLRPLLLLEDSAKEDFHGIETEPPNAVVVGLSPASFNYAHMNVAFRLLLEGAPLIAIHKGRYYQQADGLSLGPGAFVAALEYASGVTAEVVGKPETAFFHQVVDALNVPPQNAVMIGDDARDDIGGATAAGMLSILVKTGKYREGDELACSASAVCDDISAAVDWILTQRN